MSQDLHHPSHRPVAEAAQGRYDGAMRSHPLPADVLVLVSALLFAACAQGDRQPRVVVALDEAFAAARPALAHRLESSSVFGLGPAGLFGPPLVVNVTMVEGAGKALDLALAEKRRSGKPIVLVASPLIAKAILNGGTWAGNPPLLVPEWRGARAPGLWTVSTDPLPAYGAAGAAAGAFVAALSKEGGLPSCGVLFSEAPSRPRAALTAFAAAYAGASAGRPLYVRELGEQASAAISDGEHKKKGSIPISATSAAEAAVKALLGSDIRVLFLALGPDSGAAIRSATRSGLVIGADFPSPESPKSLAFRILPDDTALARALGQERMALRFDSRGNEGEGSSTRASGSKTVPALLVPGPAARDIEVGKLDFASFLSETPWQRRGR
jgi:hypothetical protein